MIPSLRGLIGQFDGARQRRAVTLKAISFATVGVVNSAVDLCVFSFAFYVLALPIVASNALSWLVAMTGSYIMNSTFTFAAESGGRLAFGRYLGFALSQVAGFVANTGTVWCLVELLLVPAWAAKVAAIGVSFAVNFSLSHFFVFRAGKTHSSSFRDDA